MNQRRWVIVAVVTLVLIAGGVILVPRWFTSETPEHQVQTPSPADKLKDLPEPERIAVLIKDLAADYHASREPVSSAATMKKVKDLASLGSKSKAVVPVLEAWLTRMFDVNQSAGPEFKEMAQAMLAVDAETPSVVVSDYLRARNLRELRHSDFCAAQLIALGKAALPAMLHGLQQEPKVPVAIKGESWSQLPRVFAEIGADSLPSLHIALNDDNPIVRRQAVRALAMMGPKHAAATLPDLETTLKDKDMRVRFLAALAVGELSAGSSASSSALEPLLADKEALVRLAAVRSLRRCPEFDRQRLAAVLVELLQKNAFSLPSWTVTRDDRLDVVRSGGFPYYQLYWEEVAVGVLIELGWNGLVPTATVLDLLKNCDHDGRHLIHLLLVQTVDKQQEAVPGLVKMLKHAQPTQRRKALLALGRFPRQALAGALADIQPALHDPDPATRWRAFLTLAAIDPETTRKKLPAPLGLLVDKGRFNPLEPFATTEWMGTRCVWQRFDAVLQPFWKHPQQQLSAHDPWTLADEETVFELARIKVVVHELERLAPRGKDVGPFLLAAWHGAARGVDDHLHGPRLLKLLGDLGPDAEPVVSDLIRALTWHEPLPIAEVLLKVGDPALPHLLDTLKDPTAGELYPAVVQVLQEFGPRAKPIVPELCKLLTTDDLERCRLVADTLGVIGPDARAALPQLIALFKHDNEQFRITVSRAVSRMGKDAVEALRKALEDPHEKIRLYAVYTLERMGPLAKEALPDLRHVMEKDAQESIRKAAQQVVAQLEKEATKH